MIRSADFSEQALEEACEAIRKFQDETGKSISLKPTKFFLVGFWTKKQIKAVRKLLKSYDNDKRKP